MKKRISILLAVSLILCSLPFFYQTDALETYRTVTKYHLDMGVIHIWSNDNGGTWQNGLDYEEKYNFEASLTFPDKIQKVVGAYVLDEHEFNWNDPTGIYTFNDVTDRLEDEGSYTDNYKPYMSSSINSIKPVLEGNHTVNLSYKAKLEGYKEDYNLSTQLNMGKFDDIINLLGGKASVKQDLYDKLEDGQDGVGAGVVGYMFFVPIVIEYQTIEKVVFEPGEFEAHLDAPKTVLIGESFHVIDQSLFGDESEFAETQLRYCIDDGSTKTVSGWVGDSLGETIEQSFDEACTVEYTITTWNVYGDSDTDSKTVVISDQEEHEIEVEADLTLPEYTYEGHTEIAKDESTFVVDGENYSATRAYAEGIARNNYKADSRTVSIHELTDTKAECTFPEKGTFDITLDIRADGGARAADTESIEVRKTPYIEDYLSGVQKQNRKQILTAKVATYPGKPLTDYSITLKDKKTGKLITLTPDNPQQNTYTIKTRVVTMTQDLEEGFAYITLEFLTKTPNYYDHSGPSPTFSFNQPKSQDFYYQIDVTDSKGDSDTASKTFAVKPDLPPKPAISMDNAFLRNEGTNIASIKAEDVTVAVDGDEVERTWYFGHGKFPSTFTNVATMEGYQKLSFGTDKIVGFHKPGVGKFAVQLFVKEKWTEPTLEEYVTDADHLTGKIRSYCDVLNVAPIVDLEITNAIYKDVLLLTNNDSEYSKALTNKTKLKQELLASKIDADIVIKKLIGSTDYTSITTKMNLNLKTPEWKSGMSDDADNYSLAADSERVYMEQWTWVGSKCNTPVRVKAYKPETGATVWTYTTNKNEGIHFGQDDYGKYLYLIYRKSNETVLLDKRTGTVAGTIPIALSSNIWLTDDSFYYLDSGTIYRIDQNTLKKITIDTNASAFSRVGKQFKYITRSETGIILNTYDPKSGDLTKTLLIDITNGKGVFQDYIPVGIGSDGKIIIYKSAGIGSDRFNGVRIYDSKGSLIKQITCGAEKVFAPKAEDGRINHLLLYTFNDRTWFRGVNLNDGKVSRDVRVSSSLSHSGGKSPDTYFESNGTSYLYIKGWFITGGTDMHGPGVVVSFDGKEVSTTAVGKIGNYDELYTSSDRYVAAFFGDNRTSTGGRLKISGIPKTIDQENLEIRKKYSDHDTYIGNAYTTADQIKATVDVPKSMVKISASRDGNLSMNNLSLTPGKKYYYEYEIKPLTDKTKTKLNGIKAVTGTTTSSQSFLRDTLYVTDSYEEDFNDDTINSFFTVTDTGKYYKGMYGAYYNGSKDNDGHMIMTFEVPAGRQAILSLDYYYDFGRSCYDKTNIFIDGKRVDENEESNDTERSHRSKIFYQILSSGTHTIECDKGEAKRGWTAVLLDNIKVDILSTTAQVSTNSFQMEDEGEWATLSGEFNIPTKLISYGAQASTFYSGPLPSEVTKTETWYSHGYHSAPEEIEYYQTVQAGYFQKVKVHLTSTYLFKHNRITYHIPGHDKVVYNRNSRHNGYNVDRWFFAGVKSPGNYTYTVEMNHGEDSQGRMDVFNIVTYPNNAVTRTGNMAFNSTNTRYFFPKVSSNGKTNLSMFLPKGQYLIKNLRIYYMEEGQKVYIQNKELKNISELPNWKLSSGLTASNVSIQQEEPDDEYIKIYQKGEKVLYNIFYDDYENDPSKAGYWVYTHLNWPPDTVHPDVGKTLTKPIDRFYLSGKYTVTHWEIDNTQRTGTVENAAPYDKESNHVTMTFYVDGEGKAPWITYIKTNPQAVKENNSYTIKIGVDDSEKDTLSLETEVYLNGKSIKKDTKTGITANATGVYPEQTISGLPKTAVGVYQVVCTVSDYSGTGIKSYKFTVLSEGKITGYVNHTDQWDNNRKKYNLKRFSDEVNRSIPMNEYVAAGPPRKRGINVFWSGERFMLRSETKGKPTKVEVKLSEYGVAGDLIETGYSATLKNTGKKTAAGEEVWEGAMWDSDMINRWGREAPEELNFLFTAHYSSGMTKTHAVKVIVDSDRDYWQLHRLW